MFHPKLVDDTV